MTRVIPWEMSREAMAGEVMDSTYTSWGERFQKMGNDYTALFGEDGQPGMLQTGFSEAGNALGFGEEAGLFQELSDAERAVERAWNTIPDRFEEYQEQFEPDPGGDDDPLQEQFDEQERIDREQEDQE